VRHLDENPRTITGIRFAAAGAPVLQVDEHLQRLTNDRVGLLPFDVRNKSYAARVALVRRVVKPCCTDILHIVLMNYSAPETKQHLLISVMRSSDESGMQKSDG
jgi:hypothetical protein